MVAVRAYRSTDNEENPLPPTAIPLAAVLEEACALWRDLAAEAQPFASVGVVGHGGETRRAHAVRLLRAAEACAAALGVPPGPPVEKWVGVVRALPDREPTAADYEALTRREVEVLRLLAEGKTDREIAAALSVSRRTVTTHVTAILNKLGVNSRAHAVARALRGGLI